MVSNSEWKEDNQLENDLRSMLVKILKDQKSLTLFREIFLNILGVQQPWTDDFTTLVYII